ncbi:metallophosphoesterase family protein [Algoriphagus lacus]|nr:metallophosphoesterase [Algoriphagus lacus]
MPQSTLDLFQDQESLKIGLISDLHLDIIHDGKERLNTFLIESLLQQPHGLIQMGDFAIPKPENLSSIDAFNKAHPRALHVLGNHDMDGGYSREEVAKTYGMPGLYYSTDMESIRLIVLDGNDPGSPKNKGGYASYIGPEQQAWLISELEKAEKPVLIVSHQPIAGIYTIDNSQEIQEILSRFATKILLAINGHAHVDQHVEVGGVHYVHINSASYYWVGEKLAHNSLPKEIHEKNPSLKFTCPYADPIFAMLSIDPAGRKITIEGKRTSWIGPSPQQLGYSILNEREQRDNLRPEIKSRKIK